MYSKLDGQFALMENEIIRAGSLCGEMISLTTEALTDEGGNRQFVEKADLLEMEIGRIEQSGESLCLKLLLSPLPARDLQQIRGILKISTEMKRIGSQAYCMAKMIQSILTKDGTRDDAKHIREMAQETIKMVTQSVNSCVRQDTASAKAVISNNNIVNRYYTQVRAVLLKRIAKDPTAGERMLDLLMIYKYLEQISSHAVNIAEWTVLAARAKEV